MAAPYTRIRGYLGERIPAGGSEADTMFTDAQIEQTWVDNSEDLDGTILELWETKAAEYASLVDTAEGTARRAMSDLYDHALKQVKRWGGASEETGDTGGGGTFIHKIVRT